MAPPLRKCRPFVSLLCSLVKFEIKLDVRIGNVEPFRQCARLSGLDGHFTCKPLVVCRKMMAKIQCLPRRAGYLSSNTV